MTKSTPLPAVPGEESDLQANFFCFPQFSCFHNEVLITCSPEF